MKLFRLIEALTEPTAYPYPVQTVEVRQTHISAVFLAGSFVYKVKKPVALGFLDFTTLERRHHFCHEEVRLNRRLAPDVYLSVVPVVRTPGGVRLEGEGEVVEWAVKMRRLPDEATFLEYLRRGEVDSRLVETLARRIASFHREAETNSRIASFGRPDAVARNILDVLDQATPRIEATIDRVVFDRVRTLTEEALERLRPLIDGRADRGVTRDCHGDLHLDHIYCFPDRAPPNDIVIIDCIEFNERFRFIDPVADMAFAAMDLSFQGRRDLARTFADAYLHAAEDEEGRALLPLYIAYRAAVRGMVEGLLLGEQEVPKGERAAARTRSRAHWLLALTELETPERRPCLVLVAGLPGSGKSTLAQALDESAGFNVVRSDMVRKELAGLPTFEPTPSILRESLYSTDWTDRTYSECRRRAEELLVRGQRVLVDANFREERHRRLFLDTAVRCGVPAVMLLCQAEPGIARARLQARQGDASDADWTIYLRVAEKWEEADEKTMRLLHPISTEGAIEQTLSQALGLLGRLGLHDDEPIRISPHKEATRCTDSLRT